MTKMKMETKLQPRSLDASELARVVGGQGTVGTRDGIGTTPTHDGIGTSPTGFGGGGMGSMGSS